MRHGLPSLRLGLVSALVLLSSTCARVLPRQDDTADVTTVQATSTFSLALEPTTLIAPTATYSTNVTTTATSAMATGAPEGSTLPTKFYKFEFTKGWVDANGNPREAILINGQTSDRGGRRPTAHGTVEPWLSQAMSDSLSSQRSKSSIIWMSLVPYILTVSSSPSARGRMEYRA
jgi:hypothetical protein